MDKPIPCDQDAETVLAPSKITLLYSSNLSEKVKAFLPQSPLFKQSGQRIKFGRKSSSDVQLNDERMSREYAEIWRDRGDDPRKFKLKNLSDKKFVCIDDYTLNYNEVYPLQNNSKIKFDFITLLVEIDPGEMDCTTYELEFKMMKDRDSSPERLKPPANHFGTTSLPLASELERKCTCHHNHMEGRVRIQAESLQLVDVMQGRLNISTPVTAYEKGIFGNNPSKMLANNLNSITKPEVKKLNIPVQSDPRCVNCGKLKREPGDYVEEYACATGKEINISITEFCACERRPVENAESTSSDNEDSLQLLRKSRQIQD
ncbi:hypothetical protein CHS0354_013510 [Potamilus streckersoni]|uniref:FHA domain-containing protein n=1 Tax=Potamilus streckersoni TaxID=2493646 RepID=A0AAE0W957_9BIVA|nr:hypothetical protein CHS0354_013510 [Potamilus streckersoni]